MAINGRNFEDGKSFDNLGGSHVTIGSSIGTHITCEFPNLKQGGAIGVHIPITNNGEVGNNSYFHKLD